MNSPIDSRNRYAIAYWSCSSIAVRCPWTENRGSESQVEDLRTYRETDESKEDRGETCDFGTI